MLQYALDLISGMRRLSSRIPVVSESMLEPADRSRSGLDERRCLWTRMEDWIGGWVEMMVSN